MILSSRHEIFITIQYVLNMLHDEVRKTKQDLSACNRRTCFVYVNQTDFFFQCTLFRRLQEKLF